MIETIPKKGYILQGSITQQNQPVDSGGKKNVVANNRLPAYRFLITGAIAIIVITFLYGFYFANTRVPEQPVTEVAFPSNQDEEDNNPMTTITTTDSLGNRYRLVMIGDRRPRFYVNDSLQLDQEPYDLLIDKLAKELWARQKEAEEQ
jgi:hypothetical protein